MKTGWKQLKIMFKGKDRQTLQTLIDNETHHWGAAEDSSAGIRHHCSNCQSKEHFWHFWDEFLSDMCQWPDKDIHSLNTQIMSFINNCKFPHNKTKETLNIMVLQYAVRYKATRPVPAQLQSPSQPLPAPQVLVWAVPEGQGEGQGWPHLPFGSWFSSLLFLPGYPLYPLQVPKNAVTLTPITNAWHIEGSAWIVVALTITLPL